MTREEAAKIIKKCKEKGFRNTFYTLEEFYTALDMAIKALEQEPIEELDFVQPHKKLSVNLEVCKMREATQKEREGIDQYIDSIAEPCEDAISRQAVNTLVDELARAISDERCCISKGRSTATIMRDICHLPPVKPQEPKMGHWIVELKENVTEYIVGTGCQVFICSACQEWQDKRSSYCPVCGSRMFEPQE